MFATGLERQLRGWLTSLLLVMAVVFIASASVFGQSPAEQKNLEFKWNSTWQWGPLWNLNLGSVITRNYRSDFGLLPGRSQKAGGYLFRSPSRAWTLSNSARAFNLGTTQDWAFSPQMGSSYASVVAAISPFVTVTNITFTNATGNGYWGTIDNWSLQELPTHDFNVLLTEPGSAASVTQNVSATINDLTVGSGDSWTLLNGQDLTIDGNSINNNGTMTLNSTGSATDLIMNSPTGTLSGSGTLTLSNNANNFMFGAAGSDVLTNKGTIEGSGNIGDGQLTLVNTGTIKANQSVPLTIAPTPGSTFSNSGTLEATGGATLIIGSTTATAFFENTGTVEAVGGTANISPTMTLNNYNPTTLTLTGGTWIVNGTSGKATLSLGLGKFGAEIVNNAATIVLNGSNANVNFVDNGGFSVLSALGANSTSGSSLTVEGGYQFKTAPCSNYPPPECEGNFTNKGTVTVGSGSLFDVTGNLTNFAGTTLTGGIFNVGGTLQFTGANIVTNASNLTLTGTGWQILNQTSGNGIANFATNASNGTFTLAGGANFTTKGNFSNFGKLTINLSSKFRVNGFLSNFNSSTNTLSGGTYNIAGALQFNGANIVTNAADLTLNGTGGQILNGTGGNGLANFATNASTGTFALAGGANFTTKGNFTNNGVLTMGPISKFGVGGKLLNFSSTTNTLTGGTFNVGGTLQFTGANIVTNAADLTLNGTGGQILNGTGGNGMANFATNASNGSFTLAGGANFTTKGNFSNFGKLTIDFKSRFTVNGFLNNFSSTNNTLTGGTYNVGGIFQFNGANIVTNAADLTLNGTGGQILNGTGGNGIANFAVNASTGSFALAGGANFTTIGGFTNNGMLTVGSGSKFKVTGNLMNFSSSTNTLTGGIFNVGGTLQFTGANIVTNAANLTLNGTSSQILNGTGGNGLLNFANNASAGVFALTWDRNFTTAGPFTNAGGLAIGSGSTFTVGGTGVLTQTQGYLADDGTMVVPGAGAAILEAGLWEGRGVINGNVTSGGTISPGDSSNTPGVLKVNGAFTANSGTNFFIIINGSTPGTQYSQFDATTANLGGTLNILRPSTFVPTIGATFGIVKFNSRMGTFTTVNGLVINSTEHFTFTYDSTGVLLSVVSGAAPQSERKYSNKQLLNLLAKTGFGREMSATPGWGTYQNSFNQISPVAPAGGLSTGPAAQSLFSMAPGGVTGGSSNSHAARISPAGGATPRMMVPMVFHVDPLSIIAKGPRQALRDLWKQPGSTNANSSYITFGVIQ
jgi:hypothetical protein